MKTVISALIVLALGTATAQSPDISSLKAKAQSGDVEAQLSLGHAYEKGEGVAKNDELAAKWYRAAAEKGNPQAQSELGVMYRLGRGVLQDKEEAVKWYRKAAAQGYGPAMFNLGTCYYNGDGVGISDRLAYSWFALAKRAGSTEAADAVTRMDSELDPVKLSAAKFTLAEIIEQGPELQQHDPKFAFEIYRDIAENSTGMKLIVQDAKYQVGRMYAEGAGVGQDSAKAISYLNASGSLSAFEYLATMYLEGKGIAPDPKKGLAALNKLIDMGDDGARMQLADYLWKGGPLPQDYKKAIKLYTALATERAYPEAFYRLGIASRDGLGTKKSIDDACFYFILAHNVGSPQAGKSGLSSCEEKTLSKAKDRAIKWAQQYPMVLKALQDNAKKPSQQPQPVEAK